VFRHGALGIPYMNAKHATEVEALRFAARGLDLVMVCPALVLGAGDQRRSSTELVRRFMLRRIPVAVDGAINVVDVEDVAPAISPRRRAVPRGSGTSSRAGTSRGTGCSPTSGGCPGIEPPAVRLPLPAAIAAAVAAERAPGPTPLDVTPIEVRAAGQWWAYRAGKARRELGWTARGHEDTLESTVAWYAEREEGRLARMGKAAADRPAPGRRPRLALRGRPLIGATLYRCRTPRTGSARAAASRASCAPRASRTTRSGCRGARPTATR
jgi:dihydroflavonol-4-reductase